MKEIITTSVLVILLIIIANPLHMWMPTVVQMLILVGIFTTFSFFAVFVLRERAQDERDGMHRMLAGRIAFLAGAGVLTIAIIVQELSGTLDTWLVAALVGMVVAKIATAIYIDRNN